MNDDNIRTGVARSWPILMLLVIAAVWFCRTPYSASNLEVPPDSEEYAIAPLQFLETGRYELLIEGRGLPPRYPPWFPLAVILPAYVLFGHEPGNAILPITFLSVAGVGFAYAIGKRISSISGGILAALAVIVLPSYSLWASQVMTDVPCAAIMLGGCLLYLHLRTTRRSIVLYFAAGMLVAIATLFRPVFAAMLLPFLLATIRQRVGFFPRAASLLSPMAAAAAATLVYNWTTFGSPFRNGYHFWIAIPMDYSTMVFSPSYLSMNLKIVAFSAIPVLFLVCIGSWLLVRMRRPAAFEASRQAFSDAAFFLALTTMPILVFHLFYFFSSHRFHIPMQTGLAVLCGAMLALLLGPGRETLLKAILPFVLVLAIIGRLAASSPVPLRRLAAERIRQYTPEDAIVISAIDPVYLGRLAGHASSRRIIPISRNIEYASKLLVRKRVNDPRLDTLNWKDPRALNIIRAHAEEAVRFVASERIEELAVQVKQGTPLYFDSTFVLEEETPVVANLRKAFRFVPRAPNLFQLQGL